jgi:hypothetical protein
MQPRVEQVVCLWARVVTKYCARHKQYFFWFNDSYVFSIWEGSSRFPFLRPEWQQEICADIKEHTALEGSFSLASANGMHHADWFVYIHCIMLLCIVCVFVFVFNCFFVICLLVSLVFGVYLLSVCFSLWLENPTNEANKKTKKQPRKQINKQIKKQTK